MCDLLFNLFLILNKIISTNFVVNKLNNKSVSIY